MISKISEKELLEYQGMGYMPDDFDDYWKRALKEMESVDAIFEMKPTNLNLKNQESFEIWFTGVGNARIYCRYMRPVGAKNAPVIFKPHGYGGRCESWYDMLSWISQGYCVMAIDARGQGGRSQDTLQIVGNTLRGHIIRGLDNENPDDLYYRQVFLDMAQIVRIAETFEEVDKNRMYALGGSQGGGLAIACAALSPQIKKVVAYYPFLSDYKYAYLNIESATAFDELSEYFRMFDPRQENVEKVFQKLAYIDIQNLAKYVKADVIMASGMRDSAVPVMTQFAMFNKLKTNKKYYLYPERGHEKLDDMDETAMQWLNE